MKRTLSAVFLSLVLAGSVISASPATGAEGTPPTLDPTTSALLTPDTDSPAPAPALLPEETTTPSSPSDAGGAATPPAVVTSPPAAVEPSVAAPSVAAPVPPRQLAATTTQALAAFTPTGAIRTKWEAMGGASGVLGEATADQVCDDSSQCSMAFGGGVIYASAATGAHAVLAASGNTGPHWAAEGGASVFGLPITDEVCTANGCYQRFSFGTDLAWTPSSGIVAVWSPGAIGRIFTALGPESYLGYPVGNELCTLKDAGCYQMFQGGAIVWSPKTGAFVSTGAIRTRWLDHGGETGFLGYPTSAELCGQPELGCYQLFQSGTIYWANPFGAHAVNGAIKLKYDLAGGLRGFLGYPRGDETCQSGGGCSQWFQNGIIYWSPYTGVHSVNGAIRVRFEAHGAQNGFLGYPVGDEMCGQPEGGCFQWFQNGLIYWSPGTGAFALNGAIKSRYESAGWYPGMGYPNSTEQCVGDECIQRFQTGYIGWSRTSGTRVYAMTECSALNDGRSRYSAYGAKRATLTFTEAYGQSHATVINCVKVANTYVADWKSDGYVGASGFKSPGVPSGPTRYLFSPTGSYSVTEAFGLGNPGTALPYTTLNPQSRWGGNPGTSTYNKYFESSSWIGWDENMWYFATRAAHDYRQGAVINYNRPPDSGIVQDAGFAIFLHMNKVPTAGCISLDDWAVVDWLQKATAGDRIIMGTRADLFR